MCWSGGFSHSYQYFSLLLKGSRKMPLELSLSPSSNHPSALKSLLLVLGLLSLSFIAASLNYQNWVAVGGPNQTRDLPWPEPQGGSRLPCGLSLVSESGPCLPQKGVTYDNYLSFVLGRGSLESRGWLTYPRQLSGIDLAQATRNL